MRAKFTEMEVFYIIESLRASIKNLDFAKNQARYRDKNEEEALRIESMQREIEALILKVK
jgi:hypothetical protein